MNLWLFLNQLYMDDIRTSVSRFTTVEQSKNLENTHVLNWTNITKEKESEIIEKYTYPIRKLAHYTLYFVLGILSFLVVKDYSINKKLIIYSLLICFLYACSDEFHQLFVIGRSASIKDVMIDTFGSLCGISIFYVFNKKNSKKPV